MPLLDRFHRFVLTAGLLAGGICTLALVTASESRAQGMHLVAHRAIYDLSLARSQKMSLEAVRGRILYDFGGNSCDGYTLQVRQVSELDNGEGKLNLSDLRSTTWEDGAGKSFRFASHNYVNQKLAVTVDGHAERQADGIQVVLKMPVAKTFHLSPNTVFPTEQIRRVLDAAHAGKKVLELPVYDGSENGEKLYSTLSVIGDKIAPDRKPDDAAADKSALTGMARWPVTVSYFEQSGKGEQTPVYTISFELYDNGISRALSLDYNDFVIAGKMNTLDIHAAKPCR